MLLNVLNRQLACVSLALFVGHTAKALAQSEFANGDMESVTSTGELVGWSTNATQRQAGYTIGATEEGVFEGRRAAYVDARSVPDEQRTFGNLMQTIDAAPYREQRVRFRAAVRVDEAQPGARAQMWLRVDLPGSGSTPNVGFFDNMNDRPITDTEWKTFEIVGEVAKDAERIALGVMAIGSCRVFVDAASLEVVTASTAKTGTATSGPNPPEAFFTPWLYLPLLACALFALGFLAPGRLGKFAFHFTFVYWLLYALPSLVGALIPVWGVRWSGAFEAGPVDRIVRWAAADVFGIERELVSAIGNGSGDTTYSYVQACVSLVLALAVAVVWSLLERNPAEPRWRKDLFCSALRTYLALTLMGYGLAKVGSFYNQFPEPGAEQLARTYGSSSPMGLLWTFMGSSRAYTFFSGAMETVSALFLLFRRTALLGALMGAGVMLNVALLNFCYDTPVKLFSTHLCVLGLVLALPHASRLTQLFLGLGAGTPITLAHPYTGRVTKWLHRAAKVYLFVIIAGLPLYRVARQESAMVPVRELLQEWKLSTLEVNGETITPTAGEVTHLRLMQRATREGEGWRTDFYAAYSGGGGLFGKATLTKDELEFGGGRGKSQLVPGEYYWSLADGELALEGMSAEAAVRASFTPAARENLLTNRGFHWINEYPFNR